jgi:hypothetical protein
MAVVEADCQPPGLARYVTLPAGSPTQRAADSKQGVAAFSGSFFGFKLVPSKRRYLVPPMLRDG